MILFTTNNKIAFYEHTGAFHFNVFQLINYLTSKCVCWLCASLYNYKYFSYWAWIWSLRKERKLYCTFIILRHIFHKMF